MDINEIITNTRKSVVSLLPLTYNTIVYKRSISYLHKHILSLYQSLQLFVIRDFSPIEINIFRKFISLSAQMTNILSYFKNNFLYSVLHFQLHHVFYRIDKLQKIVIELSTILSAENCKINFDSKVNYQNQIADFQHIKIILTTIQETGLITSKFPDIEQLIVFRLNLINDYLEKNYDEVNEILKKSNLRSSMPTSEIKKIKKEISAYQSIDIPVDDIKIIKKIDSGFLSTLYRSTRLTTGELLTVKEINSMKLTKEIWVSIYSELIQMAHIKHPFVVELVGASFHEPYRIISRYYASHSLFVALHNFSMDPNMSKYAKISSTLSDSQLTQIAYQVASGMMFLHSNGIVHCDLNSSNILIDDDGIAKIANFGLSGMIMSNFNKNEKDLFLFKHKSYDLIGKLGKPNYLAPEVLEKKKIGPKADVYSYGIILWEMAMKKIPFNEMSYQSIYDHVVSKNRRLPIISPISNELIKLINSCWNENPNERPDFSEIVELFKEGKISLKVNLSKADNSKDSWNIYSSEKSLSESKTEKNLNFLNENFSNSTILLDYNYVEMILKDPSNFKFPDIVKFLLNNMTSEMHEMIRSLYLLSTSKDFILSSSSSSSSVSFTSLFLSFASCLNFDYLIFLASKILNPNEFPSFIKLCSVNLIHNTYTRSSLSLLASYSEFFSSVPDEYFNLISDLLPQIVDRILSPKTLIKISDFTPQNIFCIFHLFSKLITLNHLNILMSHRMQIYLFFTCKVIESINKQIDLDSIATIIPLIEEYTNNEQIDSVISILEKGLNAPFSIFEFLFKKMSKDKLSKILIILLRTALKNDIESKFLDLLHLLTNDDYEFFLTEIDEILELLQIMIIEKISLKVAFYILINLAKLSSMRSFIINTFQFKLLKLILSSDQYFEMRLQFFSELYFDELFCSEMQNNKITTEIIDLIINSFQNASETEIKSILSFIYSLSCHSVGCQILKDNDLLQPFSQVFFLAPPNFLPLSLNIIINIYKYRIEVPQSSLIFSCLMHDLLKENSDKIQILTALCNILYFSSSCAQEIDLQYSILPLISIDNDPKIIILALELFLSCESLALRYLHVQLTEKIAELLSSSSMIYPDIILSSIGLLNSILSQFDIKPLLGKLKFLEIIDSRINDLKEEYPKIVEQLLNLKKRLIS